MRPRVPSERLDTLLLRTSRTFALSIPQLPQPTRREVTIAYLLFRIADTLEDATEWTVDHQVQELQRLDRLIDSPSIGDARRTAAAWDTDPPLSNPDYLDLLRATPEVLSAFLELEAPARQCIRGHIGRTIERMARFVRRGENSANLATIDELRAYCYAVAGIVGEMLTELFLLGERNLDRAAADLRDQAPVFGEALQLVNILKDSAFDAREGRRYLPDGAEPSEIFELARRDLETARQYVLCLQQHQASRGVVAFAALPVLLAWETLERVEASGPGAKLTRDDVARIVRRLDNDLESRRPAVPAFQG